MGRISNDETLLALVKRAGNLRFDDAEKQTFQPGRKLRNCYFSYLGNKGIFKVQQYLGRSSRILARFAPADEYHAARFADCCILRFWKYRRVNREPCSADFNFSLELAEQTANRPEVSSILAALESNFVQKYNLKPHLKSWHFADRRETVYRWVASWKEFAALSTRLNMLTPPVGDLKSALQSLKSSIDGLSLLVKHIEKQVLTLNQNPVEYSNEQRQQSEPREFTEPAQSTAAANPTPTGETC